MQEQAPSSNSQPDSFCPFSLRIECLDRMLNFEIVDHPVYSGLEIQGHEGKDDVFNNNSHGILVFLQRRGTNTTDVYLEKTLHLEETTKKMFSLGSGLGNWKEQHDFEMAELHVSAENGVHAEVLFHDVDGRHVYVKIDDETPFSPHRRNICHGFLAPVGAGIENPSALPLIYMKEFDMLTRKGTPPIIAIDGETATIGSIPFERCLSKRLIKVAKDLVVVSMNPDMEGDSEARTLKTTNTLHLDEDGNLTSITTHRNNHCVCMTFDTPFPHVSESLTGGSDHKNGGWSIGIDEDARLVSGTWTTQRICQERDHNHDNLQIELDVTKGWSPEGLPWLIKIVTTLVPVFRIWPESYRWVGTAQLADGQNARLLSSRWERIGGDRGELYAKVFGRGDEKSAT
jgi:hypothetical protein